MIQCAAVGFGEAGSEYESTPSPCSTWPAGESAIMEPRFSHPGCIAPRTDVDYPSHSRIAHGALGLPTLCVATNVVGPSKEPLADYNIYAECEFAAGDLRACFNGSLCLSCSLLLLKDVFRKTLEIEFLPE